MHRTLLAVCGSIERVSTIRGKDVTRAGIPTRIGKKSGRGLRPGWNRFVESDQSFAIDG
jgi:hypothetical protein